MTEAFVCDGIRTPIGRYAGKLAPVRADDLAAETLTALMQRNPSIDWANIDDVILGCANQAGEDNRNVARMALLLAGLPESVPGTTVNRLCASGLDAVAFAARSIKAGEADLIIAGGVENMSRAPFVMGKADSAYTRDHTLYDTTMGWRFINPALQKRHGTETMPETAENVAADFSISRADQDAFALRSQQRAGAAMAAGRFATEIIPVRYRSGKEDVVVSADGGQRLRRQRRRGGTHYRFRRSRKALGFNAPRPRGELRDRRCSAPHHGRRPRAGHTQTAGEGKTENQRHRRYRVE